MFLSAIHEHIELFHGLHGLQSSVEAIRDACVTSLLSGGKVVFCGNGGSASDSQHWAAELVGRFVNNDRRPLAAVSLLTDVSALTSIGNDYGFDDMFERQVLALGKPDDVLVCISTAGNSANVIKATQAGKAMGMVTVGFLGRDGGKLAREVDLALVVSANSTARIQEAHIFLGHCLCAMMEKELGVPWQGIMR